MALSSASASSAATGIGATASPAAAPVPSFTPPSTRPRQLLNNVSNNPPLLPHSQTFVHAPASSTVQAPPSPPVMAHTPKPTVSPSSPPPPPPPPPKKTSLPSPTSGTDHAQLPSLQANLSSLSINVVESSEWTMERVVQWLRARPPFAPLEPLFVENDICGKAFTGLNNQTLKALDPNLTYFQRRKLLLEIKEEFRDPAEGPRTAASITSTSISTPLDTVHTPPPTSAGSPVLQRLGSNQRIGGVSTPTPPLPSASTAPSVSMATSSPYANPNWSTNSLTHSYGMNDFATAPSPIITAAAVAAAAHRDSLEHESKFMRSPRDDGASAPTSAVNTPLFHGIDLTSRPSMDALEPLDHLPLSPTLAPATPPPPPPPPKVPGLSSRPLSDPDLSAHIFNSKVPTQVFFETTETPVRQPSFGPRQSSVNYNMHHLRANMAGGPPSIAPRTSSRDYGLSHGFNGVGRGLVPGSPSSPVVNTSNKSGPSLNERRNTPSALHIQTQSLADPSGYRRMNGHGQVSGPEPDHYYAYPNHAMHSEATVVGGTLGFGRRQSHKRNHSSADVIQYPPPVPPKTVKPRSVQVTIDNENFKRLDVSAIENASYLKKLIFEKLDIRAERDKYGIFETTELGSALVDATSHGVPQLTDAQLLELATTADNKGTTKLLVTPIKPLILPRDLDLMNPQRAAVAVGNHGRSTPYQHPQYQHSQAQSDLYHPHHPHAHALPLHTRDKTYESPHLYRDDPYFNTFAHQPDEAWGSIHPHQQAYSDSKHPHAGGRHPTPLPPLPGPTSANGTPPYGGYQQQMYRFVNDPGHPHYQGDGGPSSARTSPRVGPVVSTSQSRMMGKGGGVPSPGVDGSGINNTGNNNSSSQPRYSPLANRKALAGNPRLSLVIGSNTDQDGKLLNRGLNDHSASPGGTLGYPPRSHNGRSMTPNAYKNQSPGGSPYTEANRSGPFGLGEISPFGFGGNMSTGLPASPLSAGGKRSSFQTMTRYANSNPNSPRSSHPISSDTGSGERSGDHDDYREIRGSPMYSNNGYGGSTFNLHFLGGDGASSHLGLDGASNGLTSSTAVNTNNNLNRSQDHMEDDEGQFWGERPPLVFMLENFPQFFQGYDMDHPLIELQPPTPFQEQPPNAGSPLHHAAGLHGGNTGVMGGGSHQGSQGSLPRQQQQQLRGGQGQSPSEVASPATTADGWGSNSTMASGTYSGGSLYMTGGSGSRGSIVHTKSIRNVAQEAKDRFSKQFGSNMVRRKSTKMWGSRLAEVMPTHAAPMPSVGLGVQEEEDRDHEREQDHQPGQLSPIAGSPGGILHRSSIASMIEEAAQEHHILPPKEADHDHVPEGEVEEEVDEEHELDEDHTATSYEDQHVPEPLQTLPHQLATSQRQQQRPVVHMEAGKVMDRSQQGIYQHPQSGAIRTFRYLKGGLIGRGSFGRVYHAFNLDTCEMIAVKQVDLPTTLSERNCDRLKTSVKALFDEMEVLKDLEHENIVQYLGFSHTDDTANIFLEYVSGGSIESCLKRSGPFPEAVIKFFSRQILLGLEYIHSKRIVHRDIKAANVLVDEQGTCKISDFGISKRNAASQGGYDEDVGSLQGSVFWMAPEMVTSKAYGAKVDIWSFGCLVLEMFTGQQPWKGYAPQQALFTIGSSSAHPPIPETICEEGQRLLARCFITDANLRPTAAELLQDPFVAEQPTFKFSDYIEGKMD